MTSPAGRGGGGGRGGGEEEGGLLPQSDPLSLWIQERARQYRHTTVPSHSADHNINMYCTVESKGVYRPVMEVFDSFFSSVTL